MADAPGAGTLFDEQAPEAAEAAPMLDATAATERTDVNEAASRDDDDGDAELTRPDDFLDVVVTSADALDSSSASGVTIASTTGVVASASSLLLGSQEYIVELVVTKGSGSYCMRRPLSELLAVLQLAASAASNPHELLCTREMPAFPVKQSKDDAQIARWCGEMTHFLAGQSAVLRDVPQWITFVEESSQGIGSRAHMTAIEFILQPFSYEKLYVPRGSRHEVVVAVKQHARFIVWKFELEEHDIDFSVTFHVDPQWKARQPLPDRESGANGRATDDNDDATRDPLEHAVHARTRYLATTTGRPVEGTYKCPGEGRATLVWDNSYSRLRGKNIMYQAQVVSGEIMESATTAADALDEALRAKRKERDDALAASLSTALIVSPQTATPSTAGSLYRTFLPETLMQQSWIVSTPMSVAGKLASRLFGSQSDDVSNEPEAPGAADHKNGSDGLPSTRPRDSAQAKSLLEELNGLNMQLLERLESLEDKVVKLTVERDQERSRTHMAVVDKENTTTLVKMKELEVDGLRSELQRMQREREAWREIQSERDALLEEKHRWAMTDDFNADEHERDDNSDVSARSDMDSEVRVRLEHELGQAEAAVLRLRAELGYSLSNHLTGTSTRLEKIAREMTSAKKQYEDAMKDAEQDVVQLKQQLLKFRCQKKVLVTELRNMKTQTEGQVAVAMAEASEARMVNTRLKKQNELLLTQIRTLVDDSRDAERRVAELQQQQQLQRQQQQQQQQQLQRQQQQQQQQQQQPSDSADAAATATATATVATLAAQHTDEPSADSAGEARDETDLHTADTSGADDSPVPYTLSAADIALLNGQTKPHAAAAVAHSLDDLDSRNYQQQQQAAAATTLNPRNSGAAARRGRSEASPTSFSRHRARLVAFFETRDPSMLDQVDEMLASYAGVESSLFESLELKYSFMELNAQIAQQQ